MARNVEYSFDEVCFIFPEMGEAEFDEMAEDIKANGLELPITLHKGKIIDGRHRYLACAKFGVEPKFKNWNGKGSKVDYAIRMNRKRRQLNPSQLAMSGAKAKPIYEAEAAERQKASLKQNKKKPDKSPLVSPDTNGKAKGRSAAQAAKAVGASQASVNRAATVLKSGNEEVIKAVETGKITVTQAARQVSKPTEAKEEKPKAPTDPNGIPIREGQTAFDSLDDFKEIDNHVRKIEEIIQRIVANPGGERVRHSLQVTKSKDAFKHHSTDLENFKRVFKYERPFTACPYCVESPTNPCDGCKGTRWSCKTSFNSAPPEMKAAVEALRP